MRLRILSVLLATSMWVGTAFGTGVEICDNGVSETRDGLIDCANPDCVNDPACSFVQGCCVLTGCGHNQGGAGSGAGFEDGRTQCLEILDQAACAENVIMIPCATDSPDHECVDDHLICSEAQLVEGACAFVEACPQSGSGVSAPAASAPALAALVLILCGGGAFYLRRRRAI